MKPAKTYFLAIKIALVLSFFYVSIYISSSLFEQEMASHKSLVSGLCYSTAGEMNGIDL